MHRKGVGCHRDAGLDSALGPKFCVGDACARRGRTQIAVGDEGPFHAWCAAAAPRVSREEVI